jgi:hypothetical protein
MQDTTLWLEHPAPAGPVEAMVLERASMAARTVLDRTRGRQPVRPRDRELVEVLLDPTATEEDRRRAAEQLGLPAYARVRVTATPKGRLDVLRQKDTAQAGSPALGGQRLGIGPAVAPIELAATVDLACVAVRFTASGDASDPGPRVAHTDDLGVLVLLAQAVQTDRPPPSDVQALDRAATAAPWMLATLDAIARNGSLRSGRHGAHRASLHPPRTSHPGRAPPRLVAVGDRGTVTPRQRPHGAPPAARWMIPQSAGRRLRTTGRDSSASRAWPLRRS